MLAKDIKSDAIAVFGKCDSPVLLGKVSSAVEMLRNESLWDATLGYIDIRSLGDSNYLTLPRDVETPLGMWLDGIPSFARNKWFQFHLNGSGGYSHPDAFKRFWDDMGNFPTIYDPTYDFLLEVVFDDPADADREVVVEGYDNNGIEITVNNLSFPSVTWKKILRVVKERTEGMVYMYAIKASDPTERHLIGMYYPDEEEISYRRIKVPKCTCIRMVYRRAYHGVNTWEDYIPLNSKLALKYAFESIKAFDSSDPAKGQTYRVLAVDFANKEQKQRNPRADGLVQINMFGKRHNEHLWGMRGRCWRRPY